MKKYFTLALCACLLFWNTGIFAQVVGLEPGDKDLQLRSNKYIAELGEDDIEVMVIVPQAGAYAGYNHYGTYHDDPPWKVGDWTIIEGGGTVTGGDMYGNHGANNEKYVGHLKMPAVMPANKYVVVQVTLEPIKPGVAKIFLRKTILLQDNENMFYVNCPAFGIIDQKWITSNNGGLTNQLGQYPQGADEATKKKWDEAMAKAKASGIDLTAATGNCVAMYSKEQNITGITITGGYLEKYSHGLPNPTPIRYIIVLTFPGQKPGSFKIKSEKAITATFSLMTMGTGQSCSCADDPSLDKHPACQGGVITITDYKTGPGGYVKGTMQSNVEGLSGSTVVFGDMQGKFKANLGN